MDPLSIMPYEKKDNVWVSVTVERNLDLTELQRTTYNAFDFVSDIGGLSGFLFPFFAVVVNIWSFHSFDNTMVSNLFKKQSRKPGPDEPRDAKYRAEFTEPIVLSSNPACGDLLRTYFCFCYGKRKNQDRVL